METSNGQNPFLQAILDLPASGEIKQVVREWDIAAHNMAQMAAPPAVVLPDMLWIARAGAGKTYLLHLLAEYLYSTNLMEFYGDTLYFEFLLDYCPPEQYLAELSRLIERVEQAAGFRSDYRGILAIDITPWRGYFGQPYFSRVLEYLSSIDDNVLIIFVLENLPEEQIRPAEQVLRAFFRLRRVLLPYPSAEEFAAYCGQRLAEYGIQLARDGQQLLAESIEVLSRSRYFDGYKTVNRMCQDIAFGLVASAKYHGEEIGAAALQSYSKDSDFVKTLSELTRLRKVGLEGDKP